MVLLIASTLIMGAITGFVVSNESVFCGGLAGQILHGLLTVVCFALVGFTFLRFGWKVGVIDLVLLFSAVNMALRLSSYLRNKDLQDEGETLPHPIRKE
jgi:cellobiose-specific phosphotransferase system component IIC